MKTADVLVRVLAGVAAVAVLLVVVLLLSGGREESSRRSGSRPGEKEEAGATQGRGGARRLGENHWAIAKAAFRDYFADPARLTRDLRLQPVLGAAQNSVRHLTVSEVAPDGPMHAAGFRTGDHILKVNDRPIETLTRAVNLVQEIRGASRFTVQARRGEKVIDYRFDIE